MRTNRQFMYREFFKKNGKGLVFILLIVSLFNIAAKNQRYSAVEGEGIASSASLPFSMSSTAEKKPNMPQAPNRIDLLHTEELILQPETDSTLPQLPMQQYEPPTDLSQISSLDALRKNFYIVDKRTDMTEAYFNPSTFLSKEMALNTTNVGPKVLIFHTHSSEGYQDSDMSKGMEEGVWGVGERLKELLEQRYGIQTVHDTGRYDMVDGKGKILGAYERMEPAIRKILEENPSIEVVIDLHRDGVGEDVRLVKEVNGKQTAQIMFFNGLCQVKQNGVLQNTPGLENPYLADNLAFSFQLQMAANQLFPSFSKKIYLNAYRYSLHMLPKSILVEVGAQTNTKEEALNAMEPLSEILAQVLKNT